VPVFEIMDQHLIELWRFVELCVHRVDVMRARSRWVRIVRCMDLAPCDVIRSLDRNAFARCTGQRDVRLDQQCQSHDDADGHKCPAQPRQIPIQPLVLPAGRLPCW